MIMVAVAAAVADTPLVFFCQPAVFVMVVKPAHIFADAVIRPGYNTFPALTVAVGNIYFLTPVIQIKYIF